MGIRVKLTDVVFTDTTLPRLYVDSIMSPGSLYLLDMSHPDGYDGGALVPSAGTLIPNIAYETAAAVVGSGTRTTLSSVLANNIANAAHYKLEFSAKKGLHGLISQINIPALQSINILLPTPILTYLYNNPGRQYYVSYWSRVTRAALTQVTADVALMQASSAANNLFVFVDKETQPLAAPQRLGTRSVPVLANAPLSVGNTFRNVGYSGASGTLPAVGSMWGGWKAGATPSAYSGFEPAKAKSVILYRMYIEDLTTSGRTYAQVDAIDFALYTAAFAAGGRFAGDTFTDPATLP